MKKKVSPIIPPKEKLVGRTVYLPEGLWVRLDNLAVATERKRNEVIQILLTYAVEQEERDQGKR